MFSIIIPVHNKLPHLDRSIASVLNQSYSDFELILVDDASTDGSSEKLPEFKDQRIKLLYRDTPGPGGYAARNLGITEAANEWIVFLDADDIWEPHHLSDIKKAIVEFQNVEVIATKWETSRNGKRQVVKELTRYNRKYTQFSLTDFFYVKSLMWTGAVAIKKELFKVAGLFPEKKCKRGGDLDTWIRCLYLSRENIFINNVSAVYFRDTVNQVTDNNSNPALSICSEETINFVRSKTSDGKLLKAIDIFCAGFAFNIIIGAIKRDGVFLSSIASIIHSPFIRLRVLMKARVYWLLVFLKLK